MTLSDVSIERPVLTWMMTLALIVFGVLGYNRLGVDQFPNMEFPVLTVTTTLDNAAPEGVEEDVTDVIEEHLSTIGGVRSIRSKSFRGASQIEVEFLLGTDLDVAAQNVRDKIALARRELPRTVDPPIVGTFNPNDQPILWIPLDTTASAVTTSEYVRRHINPVLETIPGVAGVAGFGQVERNIRIWLDGDALRARKLSAVDVLGSLRRQHLELPAGTVESERLEYSVKTDAEFASLEALGNMVVVHTGDAPIYLRDVARLEDGSADVQTIARYNGERSVGMGIRKQSGGNTVAIVDEVLRRMDGIEALMPEGIGVHEHEGFIDFSQGIREAVAETEFALVFGALLAVLTVFVFLRRTRPTMIVALAIPVSLIATFGLVYLFGFTLNTMTLLGMTLAVGVVIDDAIVVLENIERHRDQGESATEAAKRGTREIAFAATAATVSVAAVFLPVYFVEGLVGSFLGEFGLVVAGSVMISLFVALTLTPMLAARIPPASPRKEGSIYQRLEHGFRGLERGYRRALLWTISHRRLTVAFTALSLVVAVLFGSQLQSEFFPSADSGIFYARMEALPGTSISASEAYLEHDEAWFLAQPETIGLFSAAGTGGGFRPPKPNMFMVFGTLASRDKRERSVQELIRDARAELGNVPGRKIRVFNPSGMMGRGGGGFEVELRGNLDLEELDRISDEFVAGLEAIPGFVDVDKSLKLGLPELRVIPDREKAASLGVDARSIAEAIQLMVGGMDVGVFKEAGKRFDIRMRLEDELRDDPASIDNLYVRSRTGEPVALRNLVHIEAGAAASDITRTNRQRSVSISSNLQHDFKLARALAAARKLGREILPPDLTLDTAGQAEAMQEGNEQFGIAIMLGILVIYMVLAAQFESLVHPLTVMLALPLAMVGALGGLFAFGHTLNIFSLIGVILLFGLVTKNSILLVDYANQLRASGLDKVEAMKQAAPIRMRPVLMTAISMIFGVLPAALGVGPGSESRGPMAIATAAGMFSSTILTLLVVPVFYLLIDDAAEWVKRGFHRVFGAKPAVATPTPH